MLCSIGATHVHAIQHYPLLLALLVAHFSSSTSIGGVLIVYPLLCLLTPPPFIARLCCVLCVWVCCCCRCLCLYSKMHKYINTGNIVSTRPDHHHPRSTLHIAILQSFHLLPWQISQRPPCCQHCRRCQPQSFVAQRRGATGSYETMCSLVHSPHHWTTLKPTAY